MFMIDGIEYRVKATIERSAEIKESSISGLMLDKSIFRDVLGTYYSYDIRLEMPLKNRDRYATLIEQLTQPVEGHAFILPYNNGTLQMTGKVEDPEDVWNVLPSGYKFWDGLRFTIAPNGPTKALTLGEAITRGRTPLPEVADVSIGDTYTYTASGWAATADADGIYY